MMYNDVAHSVPPHQLRDPLYSPLARSSDAAPSAPSAQSFRGRRVSQLQQRSVHAVSPMSADPSRSASASSGDFQRAVAATRLDREDLAAEHTLRRKTPNKILSSGYDGTPVDWAHGPSANKHIVLPQADGVHKASHLAAPAQGSEQAMRGSYHHPAAHTDLWYDGGAGGSGPGNYGQAPSLDSMLHQGQPVQHFYNGAYYQSVPTVMPAMWHSHIVPTVSNAQGPWGPYWPNGAFEPYRPAATRDARFNNQFAKITLSDLPGPIYTRDDHQARRVSDGVAGFPHSGMLAARAAEQSASRPPPPPHFASDSFFGRRQDSNPTLQADARQRHRSVAVPRSGRHSIPAPTYQHPPPTHTQWSQFQPHAIPPTEPSEKISTQSNLQFRDKTLLWAHKVYLNLLTAVQYARKINNHGKNAADKRGTQMPFYPKPPKYTSISPDALQQAFPSSAGRTYMGAANISYQNINDAEWRRDQWHSQSRHGTGHQMHHMPGDVNLQSPGYQQSYGNGMYGHQTGSPALSEPPSPVPEAQAALDMLVRLAIESNWQWIDGMLLGGCLAYGLGDHRTAYEWYSRLIACDPNHVEGLSNLAATLAIMSQYKEAEGYWVSAVKLRPSYFEAVEHLIGLLCQDSRSREAIKVIDYVEKHLRSTVEEYHPPSWELMGKALPAVDGSVDTGYRTDQHMRELSLSTVPRAFSGYNVPASENGRLLALIHAKGNMLYGLGDNLGASRAFEDAIMVSVGRSASGIGGLIRYILQVFARHVSRQKENPHSQLAPFDTILLHPEVALKTSEKMFPDGGVLPGLREIPEGQTRKAAVSVASNALLSLAKIYQDGMTSSSSSAQITKAVAGIQDILALYYLSLSLQPSPSTANNVGILLAGVQQTAPNNHSSNEAKTPKVPGVVPGSGIALALAYYNYGLNLDPRHAHLYTNLGSLLKDIGQLNAAIKMYEQAVSCDGNFDIALANLANAVKDQGRISEAIGYYQRAVNANSEFAEAVCGLANALNSVCQWSGRGGILFPNYAHDKWHVNENSQLIDARGVTLQHSGWIGRVVAIVEKQLNEGRLWGKGTMQTQEFHGLLYPGSSSFILADEDAKVRGSVTQWLSESGKEWEGAQVVRLVERATKVLQRRLYRAKYIDKKAYAPSTYRRPPLPPTLSVPAAPTVLPFHTFTCPLTASQIRKISQRNALRISVSTLRAPWLSNHVFPPPTPPAPQLNIGYVSSDFNNHPLAHLMQSVFGFHDQTRVKAFCYATTASDKSAHREQIQREAPVFHDASSWPTDRLVQQIVDDGIHILINLNGYTRGAKNEVFAARPAPIQMSFMGFAGTLGAEWCDYLLADTTAVPPSTLRPHRGNVGFTDITVDHNYSDAAGEWVYGENLIFARDTFFCCDHRQSAPDAKEPRLSWHEELERRASMRKQLFPDLPDDAIILGNFNQLYKIEPTTFRSWLRILQAVPTARLWLLRFPELGEANIRAAAVQWSAPHIAERIMFTDVAPKQEHIARARVCDLFLDTPECNAHTTAADVLWSGTPLLTLPRYPYKMCSRMAASILKGALPKGHEGDRAAADLIARDQDEYEDFAARLAGGLAAVKSGKRSHCRLLELRRILYEGRWSSALFDTRRWVRDLEEAYGIAWRRWERGEGGDIWL